MPWAVYAKEESDKSNSIVESLIASIWGLIRLMVPDETLVMPTTWGFPKVESYLVLVSLNESSSTLTM